MVEEILRPKALVVPIYTTAQRNAMNAEVGSIIYDSTQNKLSVCILNTTGAASWEMVTSS